jgi:hypothetical protein
LGVAAVDTRTGKVLWEAWRPGEVPPGASQEEKAAVEYLLVPRDHKLPGVPQLSDVPVTGLVINNPWPPGYDVPSPVASGGERLIYYRHARGVIALDRGTGKEAWRLETARNPYPSGVLEAGENLALIQIGSDVPTTIHAALVGGGKGRLMMMGLVPHTPMQRVAAAVLLHHYGDGYLRPEVQKLAGQLRERQDDPNWAEGAEALERLLGEWPKTRDRARLLNGCAEVLLGADGGNSLKGFAVPGAHRVLAWSLVQELIYGSPHDGYRPPGSTHAYDAWEERPVSLPGATKAKLADHCRKVVAEGPDAEKPFAASVLVSTGVGWAGLTDGERKGLLLSRHPSVWRWAALALVKNGRRKELIEWAAGRPADEHLHVIWVLRHDAPKEWPEAELKFWLAAAWRDPAGVASALRFGSRAVPTDFREPILAYLKREIAEPTVQTGYTQPALDLIAALHVLDDWKDAGDTPLLLEYLKHPEHHRVTRHESVWRQELRVHAVRSHVRSMLEKRGAKIAPGVVLEEEVGGKYIPEPRNRGVAE